MLLYSIHLLSSTPFPVHLLCCIFYSSFSHLEKKRASLLLFLNPFDHRGQSLSQFLDAMMEGLPSPKVPIAESVQGSGEC